MFTISLIAYMLVMYAIGYLASRRVQKRRRLRAGGAEFTAQPDDRNDDRDLVWRRVADDDDR